jgi:dolichol-phosphate mannosyltransferase
MDQMGFPMKQIDLIIPAYNEEDCVEELARRLKLVFKSESSYCFRVLIIENGSTDSTWEKCQKISQDDSRFKIIKLSRNFRMDGGLTAGLNYASGDACVFMTADLQDSPEYVSDFIREWEKGFENIYGVVTKREGVNIIRRINSKLFYWLAKKLTQNRFPENASDFRLLDKKAFLAIKGMQERNRFVRGLSSWVGFKSKGIPIVREPRFGGKSNADTAKVLDLAIKGILAYSYLPLRLLGVVGISSIFLSIALIFFLAILWIYYGVPFAGFGSLIALLLFLFGVTFFMIGILSEYLGLIYEEVKQRPNFIVTETIWL